MTEAQQRLITPNANVQVEVVNSNNGLQVIDDDQSCGGILRRQREKMHRSNGYWEYLYNIIKLFLMYMSVSLSCLAGFYAILPIALTAEGILNVGYCSDEKMLPILAAAGGIIMSIYIVLYFVKSCCPIAIEEHPVWTYINRVIYVLLILWLITCSVLVFPNFGKDPEHFSCNKTFFAFMYVTLFTIHGTLSLILMFALLFSICYPRFKDIQARNAWLT